MGKVKKIKKEDMVSAPKHSPIILAVYKPLPRFGAGCTNCK